MQRLAVRGVSSNGIFELDALRGKENGSEVQGYIGLVLAACSPKSRDINGNTH